MLRTSLPSRLFILYCCASKRINFIYLNTKLEKYHWNWRAWPNQNVFSWFAFYLISWRLESISLTYTAEWSWTVEKNILAPFSAEISYLTIPQAELSHSGGSPSVQHVGLLTTRSRNPASRLWVREFLKYSKYPGLKSIYLAISSFSICSFLLILLISVSPFNISAFFDLSYNKIIYINFSNVLPNCSPYTVSNIFITTKLQKRILDDWSFFLSILEVVEKTH